MKLRVGEVLEDRSCVYIKNAQSYVFFLVKYHIILMLYNMSYNNTYLSRSIPLPLIPKLFNILSLIIIITQIFFCLCINLKLCKGVTFQSCFILELCVALQYTILYMSSSYFYCYFLFTTPVYNLPFYTYTYLNIKQQSLR